jgi:hypothetical protein
MSGWSVFFSCDTHQIAAVYHGKRVDFVLAATVLYIRECHWSGAFPRMRSCLGGGYFRNSLLLRQGSPAMMFCLWPLYASFEFPYIVEWRGPLGGLPDLTWAGAGAKTCYVKDLSAKST